MIGKTLVITISFCSLACLVGGCAKAKCGDICEWADDCGATALSEDECIDECTDAWDDEGDDCVNAVKDLATCIKDTGCAVGLSDCDAEILDYNLACGFAW